MTNKSIFYKKFFFSLLLLFVCQPAILHAQITIGSLDSPNDSAVLELKPENSDLGFLVSRIKLKNIYDQATIKAPATGLMVFSTEDSNPAEVPKESERVRANRFYYWTGKMWTEVTSKHYVRKNMEQVFANVGAPRPALYLLDGTDKIFYPYRDMRGIFNFMQRVDNNTSRDVPMKEILNYTDDAVIFDERSSTVVLEPGIYKITFTYEFIPIFEANGADCEYSTYYMDFPTNIKESDGSIEKSTTRLFSGSRHSYGHFSDHGGSFSHAVQILTPTEWRVSLGRTSCECTRKAGFAMPNRSTSLYILRLSDPDI